MKSLFLVDDVDGQIVRRFADNHEQEQYLRSEGFKALNEFTLEEKVNAAFMAAAYLDDRIDHEAQRLDYALGDLEDDVDSLDSDVNYLKEVVQK